MKDFNMTGEKLEYTSGERSFVNYDKNGIAKEKKDSNFGFWDFILTLILLASFFGCIYLYLENRTLKQEIEQKHLLIMDFSKLIKSKKP